MDAADRDAIDALAAWFRRQLSAALEAGDRSEAERIVREALDARLSRQTIYDDVIAVAMHEIGRRWELGEITVADEHLATSISYGLLALVSELTRVERTRRMEPVLLAAVEGERHVLGLQMAADVLEGAGYPVLSLGGDVPTDDLLEIVTRHRPGICGLSATMPEAREPLTDAVRLIEDVVPSTRLMVGGRVGAQLTPLGPTSTAVADVASVVEAADGLLQSAGLN